MHHPAGCLACATALLTEASHYPAVCVSLTRTQQGASSEFWGNDPIPNLQLIEDARFAATRRVLSAIREPLPRGAVASSVCTYGPNANAGSVTNLESLGHCPGSEQEHAGCKCLHSWLELLFQQSDTHLYMVPRRRAKPRRTDLRQTPNSYYSKSAYNLQKSPKSVPIKFPSHHPLFSDVPESIPSKISSRSQSLENSAGEPSKSHGLSGIEPWMPWVGTLALSWVPALCVDDMAG